MAYKDEVTDSIKIIIVRFLEGNASDDDITLLRVWLEENPANRSYFNEVNDTYQASVTLSRFNQQKVDHAWGKLSDRIDFENKPVEIFRPIQFPFLKIAASIALLIASGFLIVWTLSRINPTQQNVIVESSRRNSTLIVLPDSSMVWLNANSTLEYPSSFGHASSREVTLKGEAFFDIKKKASQAFIVHTKSIDIQVKGTRFNVEAYKNDDTIKTTLEEGKVELQVKGDRRMYTMKPGDQITLNSKSKKIIQHKVNPANFSAWKEEEIVFDNTPLDEIVAKLENRYRIRIAMETGVDKKERFSMTIAGESLEEVLNLLQLSAQVKFKKEKDYIILFM